MWSPKPWVGYAVAVVATAVAVLVRAAFDWWFGPEPVFLIPFLLPVAVAGWLGGLRCGLFATALNVLIALFLAQPIGSFGIERPGDPVRLGVFVVVGVGISVLNHLLRGYRLRAEGYARESVGQQMVLEREVAERRYRMLLEGVPQLVWTCRADGWCDYLSPQWVEYTGVPEADQLGYAWADAVHPDDRSALLERWQHSVRTGERLDVEFRIRSAAGEYRWFRTRAVRYAESDGTPKWFGTNTDTHDQKLAESRLVELNADLERRVALRTAALQESEERFRRSFDHAPIGMALAAPDGRWLRVNRRLCEIFGYAEAELLASDFQALTHPDDRDADLGLVREVLAGEIPHYQAEKRCVHKDGHPVEVLVAVSLVRDGAGAPLHLVVQVKDISERRAAQRGLAASETLLRQFITHSPAAIAMFDREVRYLQASDRWVRDYRLDGRTLVGASHYDVFPDLPERWKAVHRRVLAGAVEWCDEDPFERADGSTEWLQWECRPWHAADGQVGGLIMFTQVVTARRKAEEALRASEELLATFFEAPGSLRGVVELADEDIVHLRDNAEAAAYFGRTPDEMRGRRASEMGVPADTIRLWVGHYRDCRRLGRPVQFEFAVPGGRWVRATVSPLAGDRYSYVAWEVTDQRRAEDALRASEEKFRLLFEQSSDAHLIFTETGGIIDCNSAAVAMLRCPDKSALLRLHPAELSPEFQPDGRRSLEKCVEMDATARRDGYHRFDWDHRRLDGEVFPCEVTLTPVTLDGRSVLLVVWHELTERKRAEAAIRESEERFRTLVEQATDAIFLHAADGTVVDLNRRAADGLGYTRDEVVGGAFRQFDPFLPPAEHARLLAELGTDRHAGKLIHFETRHRRKDGTAFPVEVRMSLVELNGRTHRMSIARDVTERKRAEDALRASEQRFRAIFDQTLQLSGLLSPDGTLLEANRTALEVGGVDPAEAIGRPFWETPWIAGDPARQARMREAVSRAAAGETVRFEVQFRAAGGAEPWADFSLKPCFDAEGRVTLLIPEGRDITARKLAEEKVASSLREKEVLLKEIHHRVKNNLQIISALLYLQSVGLPDRAVRAMFEETRGRVKSMALIHERLYRSGDLAGVDLAEYVRQLADDLYRAYTVSHESVRLDLDVTVPPLPIDVAIPCGLLLNEMISNCLKHAFKDRAAGVIGVAFRRTADGNVVLSVADDGAGFPPDFDFRTTTSFGLQLIHTLAEQLNGHADLTGGPGAAVAVTFPAPKEMSR